jgi:hypothetical protein
MRRPLALVAALLALAAPAARAVEPLDLDLTRLGAPSAGVWEAVGGVAPADAVLLASDARIRFALLATELGLAFSAPLLEPAATTGHSGFEVGLEGSSVQVHQEVIGQPVAGIQPVGYWPTHSLTPYELTIPSLHVRKALPFSIELGGRFSYLSQSSYYAAQLSAKWAFVEGLYAWPDVAARVAHTIVLGPQDLHLSTTEAALLVSKRWGIGAVASFTPYLAGRIAWLGASTDAIGFAPDEPSPAPPADVVNGAAAFPRLSALAYRTTAGLRLTVYAVTLAAEATHYGGGTFTNDAPAADEYPTYRAQATWGGSFKFGFEF